MCIGALRRAWSLSIEAVGMMINRRQFLLLAAGLATAGCQSTGNGNSAQTKTVNVGATSRYAADGVYPRYRDAGFFIVRQDDKLFAISSYCTHRKCKLSAQADRSFYCPCHGSTFDPNGHVTKGPARTDLPIFSIASNEQGELVVQIIAQK
jgi:Rieske Fe-S protein